MAKANKRFRVVVQWLYNYQIVARYVQFLWGYSQNSRIITKIGKSALKYPLLYHSYGQRALPTLIKLPRATQIPNISQFWHVYVVLFPEIVATCLNTEKRTQMPVPIPYKPQ